MIPLEVETDTIENAYTDGIIMVVIPGDINGDGIVELADFWILSQAFGSTPSDSNWNPNADINGDNIVELTDFWIISQHFRETW